MRARFFLAGLALLTLAAAPVLAGEVVYFKNGSQMAILGHAVEDGMLHVQLGPESNIAFPVEVVERVVAGDNVTEFTEDGVVTNKMVEGKETPVLDTRVGGRPLSHQIRGKWVGNQLAENPRVRRDPKSGLAAYLPFLDDSRPRVSGRQVVGRLDMLSGAAKSGENDDPTTPIGARPFGLGSVGKMPDEKSTGAKKMRFSVK